MLPPQFHLVEILSSSFIHAIRPGHYFKDTILDNYLKDTMEPLFRSEPQNKSPAGHWSRIKAKLKESIDENLFDTWIAPLTIKGTRGDDLIISVPNLIVYQGLQEFFDKIDYCKTLLGIDDLIVRFEIDSHQDKGQSKEYRQEVPGVELSQGQNPGRKDLSPLLSESLVDSSGPFSESDSRDSELAERSNGFAKVLSTRHSNSNYRFDNFVKGSSNQFALATCQNVADNPGRSYNPLFIYGSTGLGKTHLMHAVGNRVLEANPSAIVVYITTERFMNEMIYCIRYNKMWEFRQRYRQCDVFLVDDIQFISNRKATQEEFFHTFNTLYEAKKQIVITSDKFPQEIPDIEERLRNRFQWGLIADIQPPDIEHRIAILLNKADKSGIVLSYDVAEFIAANAKRNIRELEGALHRVAAFAALQGRPIDIGLAREIFHNVLSEAPKRLTIESVQQVVADHFKLKISDLKSKRRHRALTMPRQVAMYLSRSLTKSSFPEIGEKFGGKDHTTVMHAVKKIERDRSQDMDLKVNLDSLERHLEQMN